MALTKEAKAQLGARIVGHDDIGPSVVTATGLIRTGKGLITAARNDAQPEGTPSDVSGSISIPAKPKRSRKQKEAQNIIVNIEVDGAGKIPSQYTHYYKGVGVAVLGCTALSYIPAVATINEAGALGNIVKIDSISYIYCGNTFIDKDNINNIILFQRKEI